MAKQTKQFTLRLPEDLYWKLKQLPEPAEFVRRLLYQAFTEKTSERMEPRTIFVSIEKWLENTEMDFPLFVRDEYYFSKVLFWAEEALYVLKFFPGLSISKEDLEGIDWESLKEIDPRIPKEFTYFSCSVGLHGEGLYRITRIINLAINEKPSLSRLLLWQRKLLALFFRCSCLNEAYFKTREPWQSFTSANLEIFLSMGKAFIYLKDSTKQRILAAHLSGEEFRTLYLLSFYNFRPSDRPFGVHAPFSGIELEISRKTLKIGRTEFVLGEKEISVVCKSIQRFFKERLVTPTLVLDSEAI